MRKPPFSSVAEIAGSLPGLDPPRTWDEVKQIVAEDRAEAYREKMKRETHD